MNIYFIGFATLVNIRLSWENIFPCTDILMIKTLFCQEIDFLEAFSFGLLKIMILLAIIFNEFFLTEFKTLDKEITYTKKSLVSATLFD